MSGPVDLLAIGAHPDDVEIGCGGAIILASEAGLRVVVADLTRGERATAGTPEQRECERRRAAEILGVDERIELGLPDSQLGADLSHRAAIADLVRELRPSVVLAPAEADRHPDHEAAGMLVRHACFDAMLAPSPHRVTRVHHYVIHHPVEPSFVVDVSSVWERRMDAVRAYESQFGRPAGTTTTEIGAPEFLELLGARATFYGAMIGADRGEPFRSAGPLPATMLPGLGERERRPYRTYL